MNMNYILGILAVLFSEGLFALNPVLLKSNNSSFIYKALFSTITVALPSFIYILLNNKINNEKDDEKDIEILNTEDLKILLFNKNTYISSIAYFFGIPLYNFLHTQKLMNWYACISLCDYF